MACHQAKITPIVYLVKIRQNSFFCLHNKDKVNILYVAYLIGLFDLKDVCVFYKSTTIKAFDFINIVVVLIGIFSLSFNKVIFSIMINILFFPSGLHSSDPRINELSQILICLPCGIICIQVMTHHALTCHPSLPIVVLSLFRFSRHH